MDSNEKAEALEDLRLIRNTLAKSDTSIDSVWHLFIRWGILFLIDYLIYILMISVLKLFSFTLSGYTEAILIAALPIISLIISCTIIFSFFSYKSKYLKQKYYKGRQLINIWAVLVASPCIIILLTVRLPLLSILENYDHLYFYDPFALVVCVIALFFALLLLGNLTDLKFFKWFSWFTLIAGIAFILWTLTTFHSGNQGQILIVLSYIWEPVVATYLFAAGFYLKRASKKSSGD